MTVVVHGCVHPNEGGTVTGGHDVDAVQVPGTVVVTSDGKPGTQEVKVLSS